MNATYIDLHIHTSENADKLNKNYDVKTLINKITEISKEHKCLISLTDHNTINKKGVFGLARKKGRENKCVIGSRITYSKL